jgi:hypothetical protein
MTALELPAHATWAHHLTTRALGHSLDPIEVVTAHDRLAGCDWTIRAMIGYGCETDLTVRHNDMESDPQLDAIVEELKRGPEKSTRRAPTRKYPALKSIDKRATLAPDAPAPQTQALVASNGLEPTSRALEAWNARLEGAPIIDVAYQLGVSIELAKKLIQEVHTAIYEDLKANMDLNRQLDLNRIDSVLKAFLPGAKAADPDAANVVLRALQHRAKLTGQEPEAAPTRHGGAQNVMIWLQTQLPSINRIVDNLPIE